MSTLNYLIKIFQINKIIETKEHMANEEEVILKT